MDELYACGQWTVKSGQERAHPTFKEKQDRIAETLESGDRGAYVVRVQVGATAGSVR